jgi:quinol monooxygenase YgiN
MIVIAGKATIKSERWDEAVEKTQQMSALSEAEDGCSCYRVYMEPGDRNAFFLFEQWESVEALTRHFQSEHFQEFNVFLGSILAGPPDIKRYEVSAVSPL